MARLKVQVWIYRFDQATQEYFFLLLKTRKGRGEFWQPVTGGVEQEEELEAAALREAQEETSLLYPFAPRRIGHSFVFESQWGGEVTEHGFALEASSVEVQIDPHEHQAYQWVGRKDAVQMISFPSNLEMFNLLLQQLQSW